MTQADLAESLGVSRQTINSIEAGRYLPSLPLALRILACSVRPWKRSPARGGGRMMGPMTKNGNRVLSAAVLLVGGGAVAIAA